MQKIGNVRIILFTVLFLLSIMPVLGQTTDTISKKQPYPLEGRDTFFISLPTSNALNPKLVINLAPAGLAYKGNSIVGHSTNLQFYGKRWSAEGNFTGMFSAKLQSHWFAIKETESILNKTFRGQVLFGWSATKIDRHRAQLKGYVYRPNARKESVMRKKSKIFGDKLMCMKITPKVGLDRLSYAPGLRIIGGNHVIRFQTMGADYTNILGGLDFTLNTGYSSMGANQELRKFRLFRMGLVASYALSSQVYMYEMLNELTKEMVLSETVWEEINYEDRKLGFNFYVDYAFGKKDKANWSIGGALSAIPHRRYYNSDTMKLGNFDPERFLYTLKIGYRFALIQ